MAEKFQLDNWTKFGLRTLKSFDICWLLYRWRFIRIKLFAFKLNSSSPAREVPADLVLQPGEKNHLSTSRANFDAMAKCRSLKCLFFKSHASLIWIVAEWNLVPLRNVISAETSKNTHEKFACWDNPYTAILIYFYVYSQWDWLMKCLLGRPGLWPLLLSGTNFDSIGQRTT